MSEKVSFGEELVSPEEKTRRVGEVFSSVAHRYDVMNDAYFWYKNLPPESSLDNSIDPHDYFEKLVYQRATVDRFSMVTDDIDALQNQFNGISKIFGISYSLSYIDNGKSNIAAFLNYVVKGSPAETAGLKAQDIITTVDGKVVNGISDVIVNVRTRKVGDQVRVGVFRGGKPHTFVVTLTERGG